MLWSSLLLATAWIFSDPQRNTIDGYENAWVEPGIDSNRPKIDPLAWAFDFERIEKALLKVQCDAQGLGEISDETENALRQAIEQFPKELDDRELQRIQFLASKNCSSGSGHALAGLLMQYYHYNQALQSLQQTQIDMIDELTARQKYQQTEALRVQYFGEENAQKLFGRQQAFANYLFERQRIMSDETLTESDKKVRLKRLERRFQDTGYRSEDPG